MELIFCYANDLMVNIIKEDLDIEEALKKKLEFICSFCNTTCEIKKVLFLHSKLHSWYDKDDKYIDVVNDMYDDNVLDDDDTEELDLSKEKDDFER